MGIARPGSEVKSMRVGSKPDWTKTIWKEQNDEVLKSRLTYLALEAVFKQYQNFAIKRLLW